MSKTRGFVSFLHLNHMREEEEEVVLQENAIKIAMTVGKDKECCNQVTLFCLHHYFVSSHYCFFKIIFHFSPLFLISSLILIFFPRVLLVFCRLIVIFIFWILHQ
jgi:hypothetical protein